MNKVALALTMVVSGAAYAQELPHERTGTSKMKEKSLPNALVAAHFECNKDRLWANLDTMEVGPTVSDRSRRPTYRTTVKFECAPHYERYLPEDRPE